MKVIAYFRVSTAAQGRSGLGLEAQRRAVEAFCRGRSCQLLSAYTEVESGSRNGRPELAKALHHGKGNGAAVGALKEAADRHAADLAPIIAHLRSEGLTSLPALAGALNERQMRTPRGGQWHPSSVRNLLARLEQAGARI